MAKGDVSRDVRGVNIDGSSDGQWNSGVMGALTFSEGAAALFEILADD